MRHALSDVLRVHDVSSEHCETHGGWAAFQSACSGELGSNWIREHPTPPRLVTTLIALGHVFYARELCQECF